MYVQNCALLSGATLQCSVLLSYRFQVKKKQFFRNFGAIMAYGIVGVFISFGVISAGETRQGERG